MKRAQASLEFLMLVGIMAAMFVVFYAVLSGFLADFRGKENLNIAQDVLAKIENEVDLANRAYGGYERTFNIPPYLDGAPYILTLHPPSGDPITEIMIKYRGKEQALPVKARLHLDPPDPVTSGRTLMIKKSQQNGMMYLSFSS